MMSDEPTIPRPANPDETSRVGQDPRVGQVIAGKYRIVQRIARGGMARIYKAEQQPLGRIVALKELLTPRDLSDDDPQFQQRFFLEASTLSKLSHPNTVRMFDYGQQENGAFYMVMEFVEGRTLSRAIRDEGPLDPLRALHIATEIMRSLQEAHGHGIVHRDLKPSNVMLVDTVEGEGVKVLDFGIAKVMQDNSVSITMDDRIVGSPRYMAPEQIRHGNIDQRTDIYALGVLMFELLVGKPPFAGERTLETLMAHLNDPIPSVREKSPFDLPPVLDELITACLAKKPEDRPETVAALKDALRSVLVEIAETSTTASRLSTESLIRKALDKRDRRDDPLDPPTALSHPTLNRPHVAPGRSRLWIAVPLLLAGLAILTLGVGTILAVTFGARPVDDPVQTTLAEEPPTEAAPAEVPLQLTSTPDGAEVWEGTRMHGVTPLDLTLRSDGGERQFQLKLPGFEPHALLQGPSDAPVALHTELTPVLPEPVAAPRPPPEPKPRPRPKPSSDLDILIER